VVTAPRNPEVDRYLDALRHRRLPEIRALREAILAGVPGVHERVKWNAPSFGPEGEDRVTFRLHPREVFQVVFHRGARPRPLPGFTFDDPTGLLRWQAPDRAVLSLDTTPDLRPGLPECVDLVRRWLRATDPDRADDPDEITNS
jgi:hypothetical protein